MTLTGWTHYLEIAVRILRSFGFGLLLVSLGGVMLSGALSLLHGDETPFAFPANLFWLAMIGLALGPALLAISLLLTWLGEIFSH